MTDKYAVIGNPVEHSKSPFIHTQFALQTGQDIEYGRILGDVQRFAEQTRQFLAASGQGLNVTVPFKEAAWRLADELSPRAQAAEAVNTLIPLQDGQLRGDNTDGVGLVRDLADNYGYRLAGCRVLLLGAGGASSGVAGPLLASAPKLLVIANRTASRAQQLATRLSRAGPVHGCGFDQLAGQQFDLIINATAAGLRDQVPAIPDHLLAGGGWTYDMMYGALPTAFVAWGKAQGADKALDGIGMLVEQAAESFWLWRGVRPDTGPVIRRLQGR